MAEAKTKKTKGEPLVYGADFGPTGASTVVMRSGTSQDPALMNAAIQFSVALLTRHGVLKPTQVQINEAADAALLYAKGIIAKVRGQ